MQRVSHDLSYEECVAWMRELNYIDGGKPDWKRLLREAEVKTPKDVFTGRFRKGESPIDRAKVREALERAEMKRKERTKTGELVHRIEEWNEIGRILAKNPELLARALAHVAPLAEGVRLAEASREMQARSEEMLASALGSPTPAPKKPRK